MACNQHIYYFFGGRHDIVLISCIELICPNKLINLRNLWPVQHQTPRDKTHCDEYRLWSRACEQIRIESDENEMATQTNVVHSLASHLLACANKLWIEKLVSSALFTFRAVHFYIYCYCFFIWFCWKLISAIWIGEKNETTAMTPLLLHFQFLSLHAYCTQSFACRFCVAALLPDASWLDKARKENEKLI